MHAALYLTLILFCFCYQKSRSGIFLILQVVGNKADAVPCERMQYYCRRAGSIVIRPESTGFLGLRSKLFERREPLKTLKAKNQL